MLLFSKKFLSLLLVMALMFEGERHSVEGMMEKCWECDGASSKCNAKHDGGSADCFSPNNACAMTNDGGKIKKFCEGDAAIWSDNGASGGNPKCEKNKACYCNDADLCNKDISFGSGSVGTEGMFPAMSILFWMIATVAVAFLPSICIPTK